jgi:asparagine synthase (glutamine-hydrolysing)
LSRLYPYLPAIKDGGNLAAKMFFGYNLADTENPLYSHLLRWHNTSRIKSFFSDEVSAKLNDYDPHTALYEKLPNDLKKWSDLGKSQYLEATIFMSGYLLSSQGDRMAMGNSVEGRYPFLDYRVIEFCEKLPDNLKLNCLNEKFLLKKMSIGKIPESITKRSKQPYRAPIVSSFFHEGSPAYISEILSESNLKSFGIFNAEKVKSLIKKISVQKNISEVDQMAVAGILSTQLLYKMFILDKIIPPLDNLANLKIIVE